MKLRIGTRGSALALAQANDVARRLAEHGHDTEICVISTTGDRVTDRAFTDVGAFGIFVREIENALLDGRVDVAVHSYKDLPTSGPDELIVAAVPERVDVADVLLIRRAAYAPHEAIPLVRGARVGTSAARRRALLLHHRPDLTCELLRGNVPTRMNAVVEGRFDATVLAAAGIGRLRRAGAALPDLDVADVVMHRLDPHVFVPAPSQGAVAVQVRRDAADVIAAVASIDDTATAQALSAERAALALAEAGCSLPFGASCEHTPDGAFVLRAAYAPDGGVVHYASAEGDEPTHLAAAVWAQLTARAHA